MKNTLIIILLFATTVSASIFINSFNSGQLSKDFKERHDLDRTSMGSETLSNILIRPQGMAYKRPGTEYIGTKIKEIQASGNEFVPVYRYSAISENNSIWGVPFIEDQNIVRLDADAAVDVGGGIVGINYDNAAGISTMRFIAGDRIDIQGTTNYDGSHTLTSGTSLTQLQFASAFAAETFDGTETAVKYIGSLTSGTGEMAAEPNGTLYYGHNYANGTIVTKIETDGTLVYDFFSPNPAWSGVDTCYAIGIDDDYLYLSDYGANEVYKLRLSDGSQLWSSHNTTVRDLAVDSSGNVWIPYGLGPFYIRKLASADGTITSYPFSIGYGVGGGWYEIQVDNVNNKVAIGGYEVVYYTLYTVDKLKNMIIMDTDGSNVIYVKVGGDFQVSTTYTTQTIGTGCMVMKDGYIYVLIRAAAPNNMIYKYDLEGNLVDSVSSSDYPSGIFFDYFGNLVEASVNLSIDTTDRFYFYDTDLNLLDIADPLDVAMLKTWDAATGGAYYQGDIYSVYETYDAFDGVEGDYGTVTIGTSDAIRLIPFEYSTDDAYVLEFGDNYVGFLRTTP